MTDLKKNIKDTLSSTIEAGADGVVVVGPSGFPVLSSGKIEQKNKEAAAIFSVSLENLQIEREFKENLKYLLEEGLELKQPWITEIGFQYGGSFYVGAQVGGYTLIAVVKGEEFINRVKADLMNSIPSIVALFNELSTA